MARWLHLRPTTRLLGGVPNECSLLSVVVLMPLELRLMEREVEHGLTARDLFEATRAALQSNIS
jgi:hypothetical protein